MGEESKYKVKCQHSEGCGDNDGLVKVSLRAQLVAVKVTLAASSTGGRGGWNGYHFAAAILDSLLCICNSSHMTSSRPNIRVRTRSPPLPLTSALREERPRAALLTMCTANSPASIMAQPPFTRRLVFGGSGSGGRCVRSCQEGVNERAHLVGRIHVLLAGLP